MNLLLDQLNKPNSHYHTYSFCTYFHFISLLKLTDGCICIISFFFFSSPLFCFSHSQYRSLFFALNTLYFFLITKLMIFNFCDSLFLQNVINNSSCLFVNPSEMHLSLRDTKLFRFFFNTLHGISEEKKNKFQNTQLNSKRNIHLFTSNAIMVNSTNAQISELFRCLHWFVASMAIKCLQFFCYCSCILVYFPDTTKNEYFFVMA